MSSRIFIENPPPFKRAPRGEGRTLVDISIAEGVEITRQYLSAGLHITGFHHADLDRYEALQFRHEIPPERYDSFEYAQVLSQSLDSFTGILAPHRVVVYQTPEQQAPYFNELIEHGIRHVVLVGKPFSKAWDGIVYRSTVEEILAYLAHTFSRSKLYLGVIGIHLRRGEPARIANKFQAAGGRLRVMGQFIDDAHSMIRFMDELAVEFEKRKLSLEGLEWNIGLAIFSLENRAFYAKLLRKERLACEDQFRGCRTIDERIAQSIRINLEFAERLKEKAEAIGLDIGYSIQPIIERYLDGRIHPAVSGAVELARELECL